MSPDTTTKPTISVYNSSLATDVLHTKQCSTVNLYPDQYTERHIEKSKIVDDEYDQRCVLCELGITETDTAAFDPTEAALDIFEEFIIRNDKQSDDGTHTLSPPVTYSNVLDGLRTLISVCQKNVVELGFHPENVGMSIKSKQYWRQKQKENLDSNYFNTVPHGIAVSLIFYIVHGRYKNYTSLDEYLSDPPGSQGNTNENMVETYQWLKTINQAPSVDRLDNLITRYTEIETECDTRRLTYNATRIHTQPPQSDTDTDTTNKSTDSNSDESTTTQTTATELTQF